MTMGAAPRRRRRRTPSKKKAAGNATAATLLSAASSSLLLPLFAFALVPPPPNHLGVIAGSHVPFGYQTDSTHSWEYRSGGSGTGTGGDPSDNDNDDSDSPPLDPSSYVGSVHYDPIHHALYATGMTYASGIFDGVDVYGVTVEEEEELLDGVEGGIGGEDPTVSSSYWWVDMATGLRPHLEDPGVPGYSPRKGDCFYAVWGLPTTARATGEFVPGFGEGPAANYNYGGAAPGSANAVKLAHSRRFGSEFATEACSAVDMLFGTPDVHSTGGYKHDFVHDAGDMGEGGGSASGTSPGMGLEPGGSPFGPEGPPHPLYAPTPTGSPVPTTLDQSGNVVDAEFPEADSLMGDTNMAGEPYWEGTGEPFDGQPTMYPAGTPADTLGLDMGMGFSGADTSVPAPTPYPMFGDMRRSLAEVMEEKEEDAEGTGRLEEDVVVERTAAARQDGRPQRDDGQSERREKLVYQGGDVPLRMTRSVRLLMAGHVESPGDASGYLVGDLPWEQVDNEAKVFAFAQQVDVRLPMGALEDAAVAGEDDAANQDVQDAMIGIYDELEYSLHVEGMSEDQLAQSLPEDWKLDIPHEDFAKIVTSGVESKAVLNGPRPGTGATYPVSLVADTTDGKHYYVALLASDNGSANDAEEVRKYLNVDETVGEGASQRSWTDFATAGVDGATDNFGGERGRPNFGSNYRVLVKKMTIEANLNATELTDSQLALAATTYEGGTISMRNVWNQEFEPDFGEDVRPAGLLFAPSGDPDGKEDLLLLVGTTAGRGSAFGTMSEGGATTGGKAPVREDLDGFVSKLLAKDGNFAGGDKFDMNTNQFNNMHSLRIKSNPGKNDMVAGACAVPPRPIRGQRAEVISHVYVVGSTGAVLPAVPSGVRDDGFLSNYPEGVREEAMEAFLMKVELATMQTTWTVQVGAVFPGRGARGHAYGYGCAVTPDGQEVYLTGAVRDGGVATDFSSGDLDDASREPAGGTDVFVAGYSATDGRRQFLKQVGSHRDDLPSRGNGGVTTDLAGNAILAGNTRGSLMRERAGDEFRYGEDGTEAASDVFVMSFARTTGDHVLAVPVRGQTPPVPAPISPPTVPPPAPVPVPVYPSPVSQPAYDVETIPAGNEEEVNTSKGSKVEAVSIIMTFILLVAAAYAFMVYRAKKNREKEKAVLMETNLQDRGDVRLSGRRRSTWGVQKRTSSGFEGFDDLNVMVEVRNSASGGWHGVYDDEQLQAIDFGTPSAPYGADNDEGDSKDVVDQSLFMEDASLREIEDGIDGMAHYEIGEMDDVSDEDLIKAYNDAMALDIEPESPDVEFAMAGLGSGSVPDEDRQIT